MTEIEQALADWRNDRAYIDGNGNYHVRRAGRRSGPIAPWNKAAKRRFATVNDLHDAAMRRPQVIGAGWHRYCGREEAKA